MSTRFALQLLALSIALGCRSNDEEPVGSGGSAGAYAESGGLGGNTESAGSAGEGGSATEVEAGTGGSAGEGQAGEGGAVVAETVPEIPTVDESELPEPTNDVGFIEIEPHTYDDVILNSKGVKSTRTRLFYRLLVADSDAKSKPVFVFFNGGPGYTSMLLLSFGTGRLTLNADAPNDAPIANPSSFTALGSVLYIDARHCGFSYGVADDPSDSVERAAAFDQASFNPSVDAADFIRSLLRVLKKQPALVNNQVVLVGESYGGTRANLMLELLLHQPNSFYTDLELTSEIAAHYQDVFVGIPPNEFSSELFAKQFGWQVLIQPLAVGAVQSKEVSLRRKAIEMKMATALGIDGATLTANCLNNRSKTQAWCDAIDPAFVRSLLDPDSFTHWMGVAPEDVDALAASRRTGGFRFASTTPPVAEPAAWIARVGQVPAWDRYFNLYTGEHIPSGFDLLFGTAVYGYAFARSVRAANTLITNAAFDANLPEEVLVPSLRKFIEQYPGFAGTLSGADYAGTDPDAPSERIRLSFHASAELGPAAERIVYFPSYASSGHMVTVTEPAKFRSDVSVFLSETGIATASP